MTLLFLSVPLLASIVLVRRLLRPASPFRDIPGPRAVNWVTGNLLQLFNAKGLRFHHDLTRLYGDVVKIWGFFGDEQLYISDPKALQHIIVKDQDAFEETTTFIETNKVIFGEGLVATTGEQHKRQRRIVGPAFSVMQLRRLVPVFYEVARRLTDAVSDEISQGSDPLDLTSSQGGPNGSTEKDGERNEAILDMSQWMSRAALESVGQGILGYSFDPLNSPSTNLYTRAVRELIPALFSVSLIRQFAPFLSRLGPPAFRRKIVEWTPNETVQKITEMSDVMYGTARGILEGKKRLLMEEKEVGGEEGEGEKDKDTGENGEEDKMEREGLRDVISGLLRENQNSKGEKHLSDEEVIGQMTVLIFGGQDTTSSALSRILYMLASHPHIQAMLRAELRAALPDTVNDGELGYEQLSGLVWMDAVLKETLRLYPPVPFVRRVATQDRTIPLSTPIKRPGHEPLTALTIPTGTTLFVGIAAANRDRSIWGDDALEWKPERWLTGAETLNNGSDQSLPLPATTGISISVNGPAKGERLPGIYAGMLSFFGGGRSCVGYRFAQLEIKIILAILLTRFSFSLTPNEIDVDIVWNLSQIISPSYVSKGKVKEHGGSVGSGVERKEKQGMPLIVRRL
ncbi:cytochrome P450 [Stereum hirsutum FP-91666 SS1]|uniref:cytochrome P450 n=1 Tax=Stereum hirsutum (strain FP-91666) TaxID=721885 RepID=UPI0004449870|nr:cytochrome P450 [Stereum hirsutum FP-91666 SS1]EIM84054.1 cytochrome P450 [Stereum hirsutum FP-91666 SS1]